MRPSSSEREVSAGAFTISSMPATAAAAAAAYFQVPGRIIEARPPQQQRARRACWPTLRHRGCG
jgi:hypothetical protein